jgi:BON domain
MMIAEGFSGNSGLTDKTPEWVQGARECLAGPADDQEDEWPAADEWLVRHVKTAIGRCLTQPERVAVDAYDGRVTLRGAIKADEILFLIDTVAGVAEVRGVTNLLEVEL